MKRSHLTQSTVNYFGISFKQLSTTRKSSCVNARGIPPAVYQVSSAVLSWGGGGLPHPWLGGTQSLDREYLIPCWGTPFLARGYPIPVRGFPYLAGGTPSLARGMVPYPISGWEVPHPWLDVSPYLDLARAPLSLPWPGYPQEGTWDQSLGYPLERTWDQWKYYGMQILRVKKTVCPENEWIMDRSLVLDCYCHI